MSDHNSNSRPITPVRRESGLVIRFMPTGASASARKAAGGAEGGAFTDDDMDPRRNESAPRRSNSELSWRSEGISGLPTKSHSRFSRHSKSAENIDITATGPNGQTVALAIDSDREPRATGRQTRGGSSARRARIRLADLRSSREHLWLVRHEVDQFADITAFSTVQQFAEYAHETLQAEQQVPEEDSAAAAAAATDVEGIPLASEKGAQLLQMQHQLFKGAQADLLEETAAYDPQLRRNVKSLRREITREYVEQKTPGETGGPASPSHRYIPLNVKRGRMGRSSDTSSTRSDDSSRTSRSSSTASTSSSRSSDSSEKKRRRRHKRHRRSKNRRRHRSSDSGSDGSNHRRRHRNRRHRHGSSSSSSISKSRRTRTSSRGSGKSSKKSSASASSTDSSSSSNDLGRSFWVDLQTKSASAVRRVLELFPLHAMTVQEVLHPQSTDIIEVFTAHNYLFVNVLCLKLPPGETESGGAAADSPGGHFFRGPASLAPLRSDSAPHHPPLFESEEDDTYGDAVAIDDSKHIVVSAIVFEDWILTIHKEPFQGLSEVFLRLKMHFGLGRSQRSKMTIGESADNDIHRGPASHLMTSAWVLATCLEFVTESFLPDPTIALAEVDAVDEMVLLVGSEQYKQDQADLLLRIAILRRKISSQRASLFHKEQFVQQLLTPAIRTTFVTKNSGIHEHYKHTLSQLSHVAQRLDAARDILNQANSNFISNITMNLSHSSSRMSLKMELLTQVATVCLPLNLVAGIFGMNVEIPFQTDSYPSLTAFYVIIGCMGAWFLMMSPQLLSTFRQMRQQDREEGMQQIASEY